MSGIITNETQEERDARECEADMMTALSRLFGEAYMRGRAQGRNDARCDEIRRVAGLTSGGGVTPGQTAYEAWRNLPSTVRMYANTTRRCDLSGLERDEWEAIAAAVVDKHGREQAQTNAAVVDEGLVDKLARAYIDYRKQDSRWDKMSEADKSDVRYEMRIIVGELLKMPVELPTSEPIVYMLDECDIPERSTNLTKARHLSEWLRERLGPAIAAKDARIAELERMGEHACYERDDALERLAKLEKRHAELLAAAQVALEHWGSDDAEHEAAAMTELQRLVDEVA